ncbi:MAG TPA: hypothetical protein VHG92_11740 [Afifellaceae bacterium]|nr:hypothetical protein [Afifellaceae bacterium]
MFGEHRISPLTRAAINLLVGRECYRFTREERRALARTITLDRTFELPTDAIGYAVRGKRRHHNVVYFDDAKLPIQPFEAHPTFVFIDEIIRQGKGYKETALYADMHRGRRLWRQTGSEGEKARIELGSDQQFDLYYARCFRLAESIQKHGVLDLRSSEAAGFRERDAFEDNLSVGINERGEFVHYRRGKHRLAIAKVLGVRLVPATGVFVSGKYLRKEIPIWKTLLPGRLPSAISAVLDETERKAWQKADPFS